MKDRLLPPALRNPRPAIPPRTWQELLAIDATLSEIDDLLADMKPKLTEANQWRLYSICKRQLSRRVGRFATHAPAAICNHVAYEIGIRHITDTLGI